MDWTEQTYKRKASRGYRVVLKFLKQMGAQCGIERETRNARDGEKERERKTERWSETLCVEERWLDRCCLNCENEAAELLQDKELPVD